MPSGRIEFGLPGHDPQEPNVDPPKATKGRRMSKKTRKKSSTGPSNKASGEGGARETACIGQNAAAKSPGKAAARPGKKACSRSAQESQPENPAPSRFEAGRIENGRGGRRLVRGAGRGSQGARFPPAPRWRRQRLARGLLRSESWCCFSIRAPTPRAAPGRRSTSPGWRGIRRKSEPRCWAYRPTRQRPRRPFATSTNCRCLWFRMRQHEMLEAYGAWGEKSMYGRTFLGHSSHHGI